MIRKTFTSALVLAVLFLSGVVLYAQPSPNQLADRIQQITELRLANVNTVEIVTTSDMPMMSDETTSKFVKEQADGRAVLKPESEGSDHELVGGIFDGKMEEIIRSADTVTEERFAGKQTYRVEITDKDVLNEQMDQDFELEDDFEIESATLWLDRDELVPLKMEYRSDESTGIIFRVLAEDYREHSGLPVAHLVKVEIEGLDNMFSEEEIAEARQMMEQLEQQLASMPQAQREMIERQMGGQLDQYKAMLEGDSMGEFTIMVQSVKVN